MKLLLATHNRGKVAEMEQLLEGLDYSILALDSIDNEFEVEETGSSFEENSIEKAEGYGKRQNMLCVADDSGLVVDALGGAPGIYSARYAADDKERCTKLLGEMEGVTQRSARFECSACLYSPDTELISRLRAVFGRNSDFVFYPENKHVITVKGILEGEIALCEKGTHGFGFDPVVYVPELGCHLAEAESNVKNAVSHRGRAMRKIRELLEESVKE